MVPIELRVWATRHHVGEDALAELGVLLGCGSEPTTAGDASEARVQSTVRLAAPQHGMRLWRNNVGVLVDKDERPVRFGLANDSKKLNDRLKSGDLIGWRRLVITAEMVGQVVAQFVSFECKPEGWRYRGTGREPAQNRWAALIAAEGGYAKFVTGPNDV